MLQVGSGGQALPTGVTLVPIDGNGAGNTGYFSNNSFTKCVTAGFDTTFFPLMIWQRVSVLSQIQRAHDLFCNMYVAVDPAAPSSILSSLGTAGGLGVYVAQGLYTDNGNNACLSAAGDETPMFFLCDEPGFWNQQDPTTSDVVQTMAGTNTTRGSLTIPTGFMNNRPCWCNMVHPIFDSPGKISGFPALNAAGGNPASVNFGVSGGLMTPREIITFQTPNNDAIPRRMNITGTDYYYFTTGRINSSQAGAAAVYGIYKNDSFNRGLVGSPSISLPPGGTNIITFSIDNTGGGFGTGLFAPGVGAGAFLSAPIGTMQGLVTATTPGGSTSSFTVQVDPATAAGSGSSTQWSVAFSLSYDQSYRGCRYGDTVDMFRGFWQNHTPGPLYSLIENGSPGGQDGAMAFGETDLITPPRLNAAVWGAIIHGARGIVYFNVSFGGSVAYPNPPNPNGSVQADNWGVALFQSPIGSATMSLFDRGKATNYLVQTLVPIIHSQFAEGTTGYVSVTGDNLGGSTAGFRAPFRVTTPNEIAPMPYTDVPAGSATCPGFNFNNSLASAFEVMAKYYTGATIPAGSNNGVALVHNKFWIFAEYRGSGSDGANGPNANTLTATFTLNNSNGANAPSVDRFYSDAVIGAAASSLGGGTLTTIQCGDTQQMAVGDTVVIAGTSGVPGLNGTFTIVNNANFGASGRTKFDILLTFSGALTHPYGNSGAGTIIAIHNIPVTGGTTFTDTFPQGNCVGIYRVN